MNLSTCPIKELLSNLAAKGINVQMTGPDRLRVNAPKNLIKPPLPEILKSRKQEIIAALRDRTPAPEMSETEREAVAGWLESIHKLEPGWSASKAEAKAFRLLENSKRIRRKRQARESAEEYKRQGWIKIYSGYLKRAVYLIRDSSIETPERDVPRYTEKEVRALNDLSPAELLTLHDAKQIFGGQFSEVGG